MVLGPGCRLLGGEAVTSQNATVVQAAQLDVGVGQAVAEELLHLGAELVGRGRLGPGLRVAHVVGPQAVEVLGGEAAGAAPRDQLRSAVGRGRDSGGRVRRWHAGPFGTAARTVRSGAETVAPHASARSV